MQPFTDEKLKQLAAQADEECPSQLPALIQQLNENLDRLGELVPTLGKRTTADEQEVRP